MWVLAVLVFPFVLLWEIMKVNEKAHGRGKRRRRKRF